MVKNRVAALIFRICAFLICTVGLCFSLDIFEGQFSGTSLLYYTLQSNIIVWVFFGVFAVLTALDLKKNGTKGSASYFPRTAGAVLLGILLTLVVFWTLLAREKTVEYLLGYKNLGVHLINPLLMLADYIIFNGCAKMKKYDPFLYTLLPVLYFIQATVLGLAGVTYGLGSNGAVLHFPYFFIDYYKTGAWVIMYVIGISAAYIGLAFLMRFIQNRILLKKPEQNQAVSENPK